MLRTWDAGVVVWGGDSDLDAADQWVDDWQAGLEQRAAKARDLSQRIAGLTATARSSDTTVTVTVAASGTVTDLRLDERIRDQSAARTAEQILAVMSQAQSLLRQRVDEVTTQAVGADDPAGQAIIASFAARFPDPTPGRCDAAR